MMVVSCYGSHALFETIANRLNRRVWMLANIAILGIFVGMVMINAGRDGLEILGFLFVVLGIWCGGLGVFSELFSKKESLLEGGEYRLVSKVEAAGPVKAFMATAFFSLWFVALTLVTAILIWKLMR